MAAVAHGGRRQRNPDGRHANLACQHDEPPVEARRPGNRGAGHCADDPDEEREQAADRLAAGHDEPTERADDQPGEYRAEEITKHGYEPAMRTTATDSAGIATAFGPALTEASEASRTSDGSTSTGTS